MKLIKQGRVIPHCGEDDYNISNHYRGKRWTRVGDKVWTKMPVTVNFERYHTGFTKREQERVLRECTNVSLSNIITSAGRIHRHIEHFKCVSPHFELSISC